MIFISNFRYNNRKMFSKLDVCHKTINPKIFCKWGPRFVADHGNGSI